MESHRFSKFISRLIDRINISSRLIFVLTLYALLVLSLSLAFVYAPFLALSIIVLMAIVVMERTRIKRGISALNDRLRQRLTKRQ